MILFLILCVLVTGIAVLRTEIREWALRRDAEVLRIRCSELERRVSELEREDVAGRVA